MAATPAHRPDPSFDLEAEQAVLGAFFIGEDTWQRIGETFSPEVFYLVAHQSIAAAVIARCKRGEPGDPVLIRGDLADAGDPIAADLVFPLAKGLGTAANVSYYWQRLLGGRANVSDWAPALPSGPTGASLPSRGLASSPPSPGVLGTPTVPKRSPSACCGSSSRATGPAARRPTACPGGDPRSPSHRRGGAAPEPPP